MAASVSKLKEPVSPKLGEILSLTCIFSNPIPPPTNSRGKKQLKDISLSGSMFIGRRVSTFRSGIPCDRLEGQAEVRVCDGHGVGHRQLGEGGIQLVHAVLVVTPQVPAGSLAENDSATLGMVVKKVVFWQPPQKNNGTEPTKQTHAKNSEGMGLCP